MFYISYVRKSCIIIRTICFLLLLLCRTNLAQENTEAVNNTNLKGNAEQQHTKLQFYNEENVTSENLIDGVKTPIDCDFPTLPQPDISIKQIETDKIRINWSIPKRKTLSSPANITFLVNSVTGVELVRLTRDVPETCRVQLCHEDLLVPGMFVGASYFIRAAYYSFFNASDCLSDVAEYHYHAQDIQESQVLFQVMVSLIFITIFLSFLWFLWKHRMCCRNGSQIHSVLSVPMEYNNLYKNNEFEERSIADKYEIKYNQLQLGEQIGMGEFGQVFKARIPAVSGIPGVSTVAVKTLKKNASNEEYEEFKREIAVLKQIGQHQNIVKLLGCCTLCQPYCIVMEYIPCGDLLRYLRALRHCHGCYDSRAPGHLQLDTPYGESKEIISEMLKLSPSIPLNRLPSINKVVYTNLESLEKLDCVFEAKDLQHFAIQIARGMQHLENKQIVHRDLAARNVLIDERKTLKISDFGLSRRGIYVNSKQHKVPLRWLSVEAIRDNLYSNKSDVWAYGVVLWEIGTLGGDPYADIDDSTLVEFLWTGKRLEKPENCTNELYSLMQRCWLPTLDERPSFNTILEELESMSRERHIYVDFNHFNPSYMLPAFTQSTEEQCTALINGN